MKGVYGMNGSSGKSLTRASQGEFAEKPFTLYTLPSDRRAAWWLGQEAKGVAGSGGSPRRRPDDHEVVALQAEAHKVVLT